MWDFEYDEIDSLCLIVKTTARHRELAVRSSTQNGVDTALTGTFTTARLCEILRSNPNVSEEIEDVSIEWTDNDSDCSDRDLEAVGNALHDLQRFDKLYLRGCWPDAKASVLLRRMPKRKIRTMYIFGAALSPIKKLSSVMAELQRGVWIASLTLFGLSFVVLDEHDCNSLGQLLHSRQQGKTIHISFTCCTFPSLTGYLSVADGLIESGPFLSPMHGITVSDATIPSYSLSSSTKPQIDFYTRYQRKKKSPDRFREAVREHLRKYSVLNDAGRLTMLSGDSTNSVQHCVNALCHEEVRDSTDYLLDFLSTKPAIYANAALARLGRAEEMTLSNDNDSSSGLASEQGSIAGARVKRRHPQTSSSDDDDDNNNVGLASSEQGSITTGRVKRRRGQEHP